MKISRSNWKECVLPRDDTSRTAINVNFLLDAPAGKHGFLQAKDGHFYFEDGTRARFWGVNVARYNAIPSKKEARIMAGRLAKYGVNLVRFHDIDTFIIDPKCDHSQSLKKDLLDKIDYFIWLLERQGIYVYMDLLDYRKFKKGDGVRAAEKLGRGAKYISTFDPRMIELQKQYAGELLTHHNPYTAKRYVDDPGIALLEITNENSIFMTVWERSERKEDWISVWKSGVPEPYYSELKQRWNEWLVKKYGCREKLVKSWIKCEAEHALAIGEDPAKGTVEMPPVVTCADNKHISARLNEFSAFAYDIQNGYYKTMTDHLHQIGVKIPIRGTNYGIFSPANLKSYTMLDFSGDHHYWDHPNYGNESLRIHNQPMVKANPFGKNIQNTLIHAMAPVKIAGKPLVVSEWNFVWPNEWRCEGLLTVAAYACLQDWDGLIVHSYEGPIIPLSLWTRRKSNDIRHFKIASDPAIMGMFPAAALMFHRHDVRMAEDLLEIEFSRKDSFSARVWGALDQNSLYKSMPFVSRIQGRFFDQARKSDANIIIPSGLGNGNYLSDDRKIISDTGELLWNFEKGYRTINSPRTQAAIGFLKRAGRITLANLTVKCETDFCAITLSSLDDKPISSSTHLLVTTVGRAENSNQISSDQGREVKYKDMGTEPVIIEPIAVRLGIKIDDSRRAINLFALDPVGTRIKEVKMSNRDGWKWFSTQSGIIYYEVCIKQ